MTPEDKELVREMSEVSNIPGQYLLRRETTRLLALLIESEGMRMKAEWQMRHRDCQRSDGGTWYCVGPAVDARHDMTDADWILAKKKEWGI